MKQSWTCECADEVTRAWMAGLRLTAARRWRRWRCAINRLYIRSLNLTSCIAHPRNSGIWGYVWGI